MHTGIKPGITTIICMVFSLGLLAQKDSSKPSHKADANFVKSYYQNLDLGLNFGSKNMGYKTYYNDSFFLDLRPNELYVLSPAISYRWLSLSYTFTPEFMDVNSDDEEKGTTEYRRLSTSFQFGQFNAMALWSKTKGFYIANTADIDDGWKPGDPFIQFPAMEVKQFQISGSYRTNKNYSVKAVNGGDEEQLQSAWTLLPGININHFKFRIPTPQFRAGKTELTNNTDINITLPIAGTWVLAKHLYLAGVAGPIFGVDIFKSIALNNQLQPIQSKGTRVSAGLYYGVNLGYNGPKWYAGANYYSNSYRHGAGGSNERLSKKLTQFNVYGGIRLTAPRFLKKTLDWTEKLLPFLK